MRLILKQLVPGLSLGRTEVTYCLEQTWPNLLARCGDPVSHLRATITAFIQVLQHHGPTRWFLSILPRQQFYFDWEKKKLMAEDDIFFTYFLHCLSFSFFVKQTSRVRLFMSPSGSHFVVSIVAVVISTHYKVELSPIILSQMQKGLSHLPLPWDVPVQGWSIYS